VSQHLAVDRGDGEGQEVDAAVGVEPVDGLDQSDRGHLLEVVEVLTPVGMLAGNVLRHR